MKATPMLYKAPLVRRMIDDGKTNTRRVIDAPTTAGRYLLSFNRGIPEYNFGPDDRKPNGDLRWHRCPWGQPGDLIWVRENFQAFLAEGADEENWQRDCDYETGRGYKVRYVATEGRATFWDVENDDPFCDRVTPSIFMPRWASRLTLRVLDVRVERLQYISEADAEAEGVDSDNADGLFYYVPSIFPHSITAVEAGVEPRPRAMCFAKLWDHLHGDGSWSENPWVWVLSFEVIKANVATVLSGGAG